MSLTIKYKLSELLRPIAKFTFGFILLMLFALLLELTKKSNNLGFSEIVDLFKIMLMLRFFWVTYFIGVSLVILSTVMKLKRQSGRSNQE